MPVHCSASDGAIAGANNTSASKDKTNQCSGITNANRDASDSLPVIIDYHTR